MPTMAPTEDELKRAADLKLWIESRMAEHQDEIEKLKEALAMVDSVLRASSFRPALEVSERVKEEISQIAERREIRRDKGGGVLAYASITPGRISVELLPEVNLKVDTPPLKSFLLGKILQGMRARDEELTLKGKIKKGEEIRFKLDEKNGKLERVVIDNYRDRDRLTELLNTISWTFSRMLEK